MYIGVNNIARKIKSAYVGVNGTARKVKAVYVGDANGKARLVWTAGIPYDIILATGTTSFTVSKDGGATFTTVSTNLPVAVNVLEYDFGKEIFVTIGRDLIPYYSNDLITWTAGTMGWSSPSSGGSLGQLICADGVYIVSIIRTKTYISTDLHNWRELHWHSFPEFITHDKKTRNTMIYYEASDGTGNVGLDVVDINGTIISSSTDNNVAFAEPIIVNDCFITSYRNVLYIRATNLTSYSAKELPFTSYAISSDTPKFAYINNTLIALQGGKVYTSTNMGDSWSQVGTFPMGMNFSLKYISGNYILYVYKYSSTSPNYNYYVYKSTDLNTWSQIYYSTSGAKVFVSKENGGLY